MVRHFLQQAKPVAGYWRINNWPISEYKPLCCLCSSSHSHPYRHRCYTCTLSHQRTSQPHYFPCQNYPCLSIMSPSSTCSVTNSVWPHQLFSPPTCPHTNLSTLCSYRLLSILPCESYLCANSSISRLSFSPAPSIYEFTETTHQNPPHNQHSPHNCHSTISQTPISYFYVDCNVAGC